MLGVHVALTGSPALGEWKQEDDKLKVVYNSESKVNLGYMIP